MKKFAFAFAPLLMAGFIISHNNLQNFSGNTATIDSTYDGPYVVYKDDKVFIKNISDDNNVKAAKVDSVNISRKTGITLTVGTDAAGKTFSVKLKDNLQIEKSEFKKVNKYFILSDIEGNFSAFRKLLQAGGVIDTNFNWTFGDGHLVLTGDFFDRGDQVTQVLWLIYSLEDKAKAGGGYVHFVLGNHEIMNMSGDIRYLHGKYLQDAALLNEDYVYGLYGENSEIGRWLRTKNIVEKVGNILFMHGGISPYINDMDISLNKLNEISRPWYPDTTYKYKDKRLEIIFGDYGPFWYRGYYQPALTASTSQIDSTLDKFGVKHIATGHTIIADTISFLFGGKLINTDVHHVKGHSEAVLIENEKYYRVTASGEKFQVKG